MRSNRDLDSKTPRHNRQGLTPCEPPHPPTLHLRQNNNREERDCRRRWGLVWGWFQPTSQISLRHVQHSVSLPLTSCRCKQHWPQTSANSWKENLRNVWINFWTDSNFIVFLIVFLCGNLWLLAKRCWISTHFWGIVWTFGTNSYSKSESALKQQCKDDTSPL